MNGRKLFSLAALLQKHEPGRIVSKLCCGYRAFADELSAKGGYLAYLREEYPDFQIADLLVIEISRTDIERVLSDGEVA